MLPENSPVVSEEVRAAGILLQFRTLALDLRVPLPRRDQMQSLEKLKPLALLLLRVALGVIFVYHGYPKLFTHARETMQGFAHMGFPPYFAYIAGVLEFFGGLMLIAGLFTRVAGSLLAGEMAVALWKGHMILLDPLAVHNYQFPLMMAAGSFALAALGAGAISFDQVLFREGRKAPRKPKNKD
jgi:putative oxidoreductase